MANVLSKERRNAIVQAICEGNSIRACQRMSGTAKSTILRLVLAVGEGCAQLHDAMVWGVVASEIECCERGSFVWKKGAPPADGDPSEHGDAWTLIAFERQSKLVISYVSGKREQTTADSFSVDVRSRVRGLLEPASNHLARAARSVDRPEVFGGPPLSRMSAPHAERLDLTTWHVVDRTGRLCRASWKTLRGYKARVALGVAVYNFTTMYSRTDVTPAMEAGLTDHVWDIDELVSSSFALPRLGPAEPGRGSVAQFRAQGGAFAAEHRHSMRF